MSITSALQWRYATKRMNGNQIPKEKMDTILNAIALAPSSFGLQPYSILIIENKELLDKIKPIAMNQPQITEASAVVVFATWDRLSQDRIDAYLNRIATVRNVSNESLKQLRDAIEGQLKNSDADNFVWNSKQTYIALGIGLLAAADEKIDSTPIEGFDKDLLDQVLQLKEKGLRSSIIMTLGYRDAKNDYLVNLKKVRREKEKLFIHIV